MWQVEVPRYIERRVLAHLFLLYLVDSAVYQTRCSCHLRADDQVAEISPALEGVTGLEQVPTGIAAGVKISRRRRKRDRLRRCRGEFPCAAARRSSHPPGTIISSRG